MQSSKLPYINGFVSSLIPKPIQKTDITSGGHPINTVSFDILENDSNTGEQG